ncbi:MAG: carbohydrate binding family 9 domain-containing protein [Bacteroidia bacterium]|nr:carbohydrate binding family 9 domain-containing protein [Bacteroidia bacterium]
MFRYLLFWGMLCSWFYLHAQVSFPNTLSALPIQQNIVLDGKLDDSVWQVAPRIQNFTQRELFVDQPSSERTEVAVAYNNDFLYIAVWCYDSQPDAIIAKELKRDFNYDIDDNFIVIIDTYKDKRNGFMFVTNPNAARSDLQVFNNGGSVNAFWNGVWNVKTTRTAKGWFAEFEIPFYTFKYRNGTAQQEWGINFERNIRHKREQVLWQGWSRNNRIFQVNQAGILTGLNQLTDKRFVEIKPYALGGNQHTPGNNKGVGNIGGDINYLLSPTYRLNLTFNTDFAQVEADQQQINITRFPLFFPELREFFLEGDDFFNMGFGGNRIIPFYTRRIGLTDKREPIPILAGARLLGKEQNSTVGLMSLQTADALGTPTTNYTTGSWRQDVGKQSVVGAMSTNKIANGRWHTTTGINGRFSTARFLRNKNLDIGGAFIQTFNTDSGYQPKAFAYRAFVSYPNDRFSLFASTQRSPAAFNPEVGLQLRSNFAESFIEFAFKPRPKNRLLWIRQFEFIPLTITDTRYDDTKQLQSFEYRVQFFGMETRKGERFTMEYKRVAEGLIANFNLAGDVVVPKGTYWWNQYEAELRTFRGRTLSLTNRIIWGDFYNGQNLRNRAELLWRTGKYYNINLRYEFNDLTLPTGTFRSHLIGSRMEYAINPNAFGSLLTQWNTAQEELNINFRLQWIPKIGTDFFLIVNQIYDTQTQQFDLKRGTILGKLIWRFTL